MQAGAGEDAARSSARAGHGRQKLRKNRETVVTTEAQRLENKGLLSLPLRASVVRPAFIHACRRAALRWSRSLRRSRGQHLRVGIGARERPRAGLHLRGLRGKYGIMMRMLSQGSYALRSWLQLATHRCLPTAPGELLKALLQEFILTTSGRDYGFLISVHCLYLSVCRWCSAFAKVSEQR